MRKKIRIGTRESELAVWQATRVKELLEEGGHEAELIYIKSEGDTDLKTPLYEIGVQGIFTRTLDIALLNASIDIAVHSMKDVPTQMPKGIITASILPRASYKDILVPKTDIAFLDSGAPAVIATSSIRRKAQWLNKYPDHTLENLRGNVNTRLQKVKDNSWNGAIFAAAGVERINLRPATAIDLDWMLPAPAQGAILVACREDDTYSFDACQAFHDKDTALCTGLERDFLRALMGGCSTPISALAQMKDGQLIFEGNILSVDGKEKLEVKRTVPVSAAANIGAEAAKALLSKGARQILDAIKA